MEVFALWHVWASSFGIAAAVLAVSSHVLLQWQRNHHRYRLMQLSLERGNVDLFQEPPPWLISMRRGVAVLVLGLGLTAAGAGAYALVQGVDLPESLPAQSTGTLGAADKLASPTVDALHERSARPKPPNPAMEKWRRAQHQQAAGLAAIGCGLLIVLLGGVRTGFAVIERRHTRKAAQPTT